MTTSAVREISEGAPRSTPSSGSEPDVVYFDVGTTDITSVYVEDPRIEEYAKVAAKMARFEVLDDDTVFASVDNLPGAWGQGPSESDARRRLEESITSWTLVRIERGLDVPSIEGIQPAES